MYMTASATIRPNSKTKPSSPRLPCEIISPTRSTNQLLPRISWNNRLAFFLQMVSSLIRVAPFLDRLTVDCPTVEPLIQISTNSSITSSQRKRHLSCLSSLALSPVPTRQWLVPHHRLLLPSLDSGSASDLTLPACRLCDLRYASSVTTLCLILEVWQGKSLD